MKRKSYFISLGFLLSSVLSASSANYFVKANAPSGNNGTSWETAFNLADLITNLSGGAISDGSNVYFAGGTYTYPATQASGNALITGIKMQNKAVNLYGGYPTNLTGSSVPELTYPTSTPTVLNGDRNGDGVPNSGDVRNLIFIQTTTAESSKYIKEDRSITIQGFTLTGAYYDGTKTTELGAINVDMTQTVTIKNCVFKGNKCVNAGGAFSNSGSKTHFIDCIFEENEGKDAGIAINTSKRGDADKVFKPAVVVERCLINNNAAVGTGSVAGGSAIRINTGSVYILNSTITDNKGYKQGAIDMNADTYLYIGSSTIANNQEESPAYGSAIYGRTGVPNIRVINSYILGITDEEMTPAICLDAMTTPVSKVLISDGGNVFGYCYFYGEASGGFSDNFETDVLIDGYDSYGAENTPKALFGQCSLVDKGGFSKVLVPNEIKRVYSKTDFEGVYASEYKCTFPINDGVDQRDAERPEMIAVGAYDTGKLSGIESVSADDNDYFKVESLGGGIFRIPAVATNVAVYDLSGKTVAKVNNTDVINLAGIARGVYILRADNKAVKIVL